MSGRTRGIAFGLLAVACTLGIAVAVALAVQGADAPAGDSPAAQGMLSAAHNAKRPAILFRDIGQRPSQDAGRLALTQLPGPTGRKIGPLRCDREYFAAGRGICLAPGSGFAAGYEARIFGPDMRVRGSVEVQGVPSRARVAPDGRYGSVTMFVAGHSYAVAGDFSTDTILIDLVRGRRIADLEDFVVMRGARRVTAVDANFWGVTFARDSDRFYATMATGGKTYLIEGSVRARRARVLHENVECPSLSPDGTRIAYKRRSANAKAPWRLTVLDLATMRETPLAELRSVDDQAEWLGNDRVLYGIDRGIWMIRADGGGQPRRLIAGADSPAVVRW